MVLDCKVCTILSLELRSKTCLRSQDYSQLFHATGVKAIRVNHNVGGDSWGRGFILGFHEWG